MDILFVYIYISNDEEETFIRLFRQNRVECWEKLHREARVNSVRVNERIPLYSNDWWGRIGWKGGVETVVVCGMQPGPGAPTAIYK